MASSAQFDETRLDPLAVGNAVDQICDQFESSWRRGEHPRIAEYLLETDEIVRSTLFVELVKMDLHYRRLAGESPSLHEYETLFPDLSEALSQLDEGANDLTLTKPWRAPTPRQRVGDYELLTPVGAGSFGNVWTAWHSALERNVAVKLPNHKLEGPQQVELFLHEARAAAKLDHPNIVRVYDFGEHEKGGYIVFGLVNGIDLKHWLTLHKPDVQQAAALMAKLADGVAHAHEHGVVHRDLKPSNVLMDKGDEPRISDFGLAKRMDVEQSIAGGSEVMGTIPYMSPEQVRGDNKGVDALSDVYSLGVLLYEMLTGSVPFQGDQRSVMYQVVHDRPKPPHEIAKTVPRDLETICLKCLSKEKADRYASAGELRDDLQRYLRDEPIRARPISRANRAWRWVRRNRVTAAVIGIGSIAVLSGAGMMAYSFALPVGDQPRHVTLTSEPAGANVAFIPLDELTGEPLPDQIIHCTGTTPLEEDLPPGNYLVEVYLTDGSGRFHEVYRRVPFVEEEGMHGGYPHLRWFVLGDGTIELPRVAIPAFSVVNGMATFAGDPLFSVGEASMIAPIHRRSVPAFLMDTSEVSAGKYKSAIDISPGRTDVLSIPDDHAVILPWHAAVVAAEAMGKRLPHEVEYEYAATWGGKVDYSWEATSRNQPLKSPTDFGPVETPTLDAVPTDPPVYGLCSNVAEWTMTQLTAFYPASAMAIPVQKAKPEMADQRIVRGGDSSVISGHPDASKEARNPRQRFGVWSSARDHAIGFRCVRSKRPRLKPEDFIRVIPNHAEVAPD